MGDWGKKKQRSLYERIRHLAKNTTRKILNILSAGKLCHALCCVHNFMDKSFYSPQTSAKKRQEENFCEAQKVYTMLPMRLPHNHTTVKKPFSPLLEAYEKLCVGESFVCKSINFTCFMRPACRQVILGIYSFISLFLVRASSKCSLYIVCLPLHDFTSVSTLLKVDVFVFGICCREEGSSCMYAKDLDIS